MKTLFALTLLASSLLVATSGHAQTKDQDGQWRGIAGLSAALSSGNNDSRTLALNADVARKTVNDKTSVGAIVQYGSAGGVTTSNKWGLSGQYDFNLGASLFGFGKAGLAGDKTTDLSLRTNIGAGLGSHVLAGGSTTWDIYGGVGYSRDKYNHSEHVGSSTGTEFSRAEIVLGEESNHKISDAVTFKQRLELFPGISGERGLRTSFNAGLAVAMTKDVGLTVSLMNTTNNRAPLGTKRSDTSLLAGVSLKLGN